MSRKATDTNTAPLWYTYDYRNMAKFIRSWGVSIETFLSLEYIEENTFNIPAEIWNLSHYSKDKDFKEKINSYIMAEELSSHKLPTLLSDCVTPIKELDWIWQGFIAKKQVIELTSKPKQGKTRLAAALASKVSNGDNFLGYSTYKGKTLLFLMEDNENSAKKRFRDFNAKQDNIYFLAQPLANIFDLRAFLNIHNDIDLIIIDTYVKFAGIKDVNSYSENAIALTGLTTIANEYNVGIIIIHHARKSKYDDESTGDESIGSSSILGGVDGVLNISRDIKNDKLMILKSNLRHTAPIEDLSYTLDEPSISTAYKEVEEKSREDIVLALMEDDIEYKTKELLELIENELNIGVATIQRLLKSMVDKSLINRKKDDEQSHGYAYYKGVMKI
jgi:hypothetical protein